MQNNYENSRISKDKNLFCQSLITAANSDSELYAPVEVFALVRSAILLVSITVIA